MATIWQQVHVFQHAARSVEDSVMQHLLCGHYTFHQVGTHMPLKWFHCHMVDKRLITTMHVIPVSDVAVTLVWYGNIWAYRGALNLAGIPGLPLHRFLSMCVCGWLGG